MRHLWRAQLGRLLRLRAPKWPFPIHALPEIESASARLRGTPIPRVVHRIWLGPKRPPLYTIASCRGANPDWLHILWTDTNLPETTNRKVFDAFGKTWYAKADILRYEVLYRFGGVDVDADQLCLRGFGDLLSAGDDFFAGFQNLGDPDLGEEGRTTLIANAVIGASPRHPIVGAVIRNIGAGIEADKLPWIHVGPGAFTKAIEETPARAVVYPFHEFYPYHLSETIPEAPEEMLKAIHYGSRGVSLWGSTLHNYYGRCRKPARRRIGGGPLLAAEDFVRRHPLLAPTLPHLEPLLRPARRSPSRSALRKIPEARPAHPAPHTRSVPGDGPSFRKAKRHSWRCNLQTESASTWRPRLAGYNYSVR